MSYKDFHPDEDAHFFYAHDKVDVPTKIAREIKLWITEQLVGGVGLSVTLEELEDQRPRQFGFIQRVLVAMWMNRQVLFKVDDPDSLLITATARLRKWYKTAIDEPEKLELPPRKGAKKKTKERPKDSERRSLRGGNRPRAETLQKKVKAYLLKVSEPQITRTEICQQVGLSPSTLSRDKTYKKLEAEVAGYLRDGKTPEQVSAAYDSRVGEWVTIVQDPEAELDP